MPSQIRPRMAGQTRTKIGQAARARSRWPAQKKPTKAPGVTREKVRELVKKSQEHLIVANPRLGAAGASLDVPKESSTVGSVQVTQAAIEPNNVRQGQPPSGMRIFSLRPNRADRPRNTAPLRPQSHSLLSFITPHAGQHDEPLPSNDDPDLEPRFICKDCGIPRATIRRAHAQDGGWVCCYCRDKVPVVWQGV